MYIYASFLALRRYQSCEARLLRFYCVICFIEFFPYLLFSWYSLVPRCFVDGKSKFQNVYLSCVRQTYNNVWAIVVQLRVGNKLNASSYFDPSLTPTYNRTPLVAFPNLSCERMCSGSCVLTIFRRKKYTTLSRLSLKAGVKQLDIFRACSHTYSCVLSKISSWYSWNNGSRIRYRVPPPCISQSFVSDFDLCHVWEIFQAVYGFRMCASHLGVRSWILNRHYTIKIFRKKKFV